MYTITYANLWDTDQRKLSAWADRQRITGCTVRYCVGGKIEVIPGAQTTVDVEQIASQGAQAMGHGVTYTIRELA